MVTPVADLVTVPDLTKYQAADPTTIVKQAQASVRSYCGWHVAPSYADQVTLDGHGAKQRHIWLPSLKVTSIESITNEGVELTADDYDWSAIGLVELRSGYWSERPGQIVVAFTHGYGTPPADVVEVAASIASRAAEAPSGNVREQAGQVSIQRGTINGVAGGIALLQHEKELLDAYRIVNRP